MLFGTNWVVWKGWLKVLISQKCLRQNFGLLFDRTGHTAEHCFHFISLGVVFSLWPDLDLDEIFFEKMTEPKASTSGNQPVIEVNFNAADADAGPQDPGMDLTF